MIWDTFMFRDELDMLELRLTHMQDYDVVHVIVEAPVSHRGSHKPLHYALNEKRFARWAGRITVVTCDHLPLSARSSTVTAWDREHLQRDCAREMLLSAAGPADMVLLADVDEIPDMDRLKGIPPGQPVTLRQRIFAFAVDWEFPHEEDTSVLCPAQLLGYATPSFLRDRRQAYAVQDHAGWHFSWLGGSQAIRLKVQSHCHDEQDSQLLQGADNNVLYEQGVGIWGFNLDPRDVDATWPAYIRDRKCPKGWFRPRKKEA